MREVFFRYAVIEVLKQRMPDVVQYAAQEYASEIRSGDYFYKEILRAEMGRSATATADTVDYLSVGVKRGDERFIDVRVHA
jgi:hypothetical protein